MKPILLRLEPWLLFAAVLGLLLVVQGNHLVYTNDEGIILDASRRMVEGEHPYVDFFGYMSPGSYWLQAAVFQLFGVSLRAGRLVVLADLAALCAMILWLTARFASRRAGWIAALLFLAFQATQPGLLTAQHRWDSAALSLLSIVLLVRGSDSRASLWFAAAGVVQAAAVFFTPSMGLLVMATAAWLLLQPSLRPHLAPFAAGGILLAATLLAAMIFNGTLEAFLRQMLWLKENYSGVNIMPYGSIIGGYGALFRGATGVELILRTGIVLCIALPAILPVAALAAWMIAFLRGRKPADASLILLLLAAMAASVATAFPRADVMHLAFVAAPVTVLFAVWSARHLPPRAGFAMVLFLGFWAVLFTWNYALMRTGERIVSLPAGGLRVAASEAAAWERLAALVRPGDTAFVHPYMPVLYFLTQTRNPTRFSFLASGMMKAREERIALDELDRDPPRWVLHLPLSTEEYMRVLPSASPADSRMEALERWIEAHFRPLPDPLYVGGYQLLERKP